MSDEERRSPKNGIWLCANCATEIDKDPARFPVVLLRKWKEDAEKEAQKLLEDPNCRERRLHGEQLAAFLVEAQELKSRLDESPLPVLDHNEWVGRVATYLRNNLSVAHEVRFSDFSGMRFYGDSSDHSKMSRSLEGRSRRLHEFLAEMST